jgi:hypothetical protein
LLELCCRIAPALDSGRQVERAAASLDQPDQRVTARHSAAILIGADQRRCGTAAPSQFVL